MFIQHFIIKMKEFNYSPWYIGSRTAEVLDFLEKTTEENKKKENGGESMSDSKELEIENAELSEKILVLKNELRTLSIDHAKDNRKRAEIGSRIARIQKLIAEIVEYLSS